MSENALKPNRLVRLPLTKQKKRSGQSPFKVKSDAGPKDIPWSPPALTVEVGNSFKPETKVVPSEDANLKSAGQEGEQTAGDESPESNYLVSEGGLLLMNDEAPDYAYKSTGYERGHLVQGASPWHSPLWGRESSQDSKDAVLENSKTPDRVLKKKYLDYILT